VIGGSNYCVFHEPTLAKERQAARRRGGQASTSARTPALLPPVEFDFSDPIKISALLTQAANLVWDGRLDVKRAYALCGLAGCALKAYELGVGAQQQQRILRMLEENRNRPADPADAAEMLRFASDEDHDRALAKVKWKTNSEFRPQSDQEPCL
jgi:hypothetical protein